MIRDPDACEWRFRVREGREGGGWYRWYTYSLPFTGTYDEALEEARAVAVVVGGQAVPVPVIQRKVKP